MYEAKFKGGRAVNVKVDRGDKMEFNR